VKQGSKLNASCFWIVTGWQEQKLGIKVKQARKIDGIFKIVAKNSL
jgi:hypothetical protein